ncbi:MBL fold metallo-hydrolase [Bacillus chungangensis]|uniref:Glyoxylase-like metal-dependent hydrolase (Beta-lactamase superfamily II) n=1 Tax=Bacillus chungangensis TaxID=587633 RepID=A0ABT9WPY6_9BACI|nr:MBL fold metallo-hydrolase [Bacillus chungangensis]MDQ0174825.1 glyoxylase-like metal-dependent hydrolase (beta-lactamase superfamily II) [Bacillus chungangensis]
MSMKLPVTSTNTPKCDLTVLNAGFYHASLDGLKKGSQKEKIWGPALFYLIKHPKQGYFLFDTGYSTRFFDVTRFFPYRLLRIVTPVRVTEKENASVQLKNMNIHPDEVTVILSHMHVDHVGGIHDFPRSRIIVSKREWEFTRRSSLSLIKHGYIKALFNQIDSNNIQTIDFEQSSRYGLFQQSRDLLGDESLILVPLPGHSIGQMGLLINGPDHRYFLAADAVYVRGNYRENKAGSWVSRFAHYNHIQYENLFPLLNGLEKENSNLIILPSHDLDIYQQYVEKRN